MEIQIKYLFLKTKAGILLLPIRTSAELLCCLRTEFDGLIMLWIFENMLIHTHRNLFPENYADVHLLDIIIVLYG